MESEVKTDHYHLKILQFKCTFESYPAKRALCLGVSFLCMEKISEVIQRTGKGLIDSITFITVIIFQRYSVPGSAVFRSSS